MGKYTMEENKSTIRFPAVGGPMATHKFRFDKSVTDIPLVIPYESLGGVYMFRGDKYVWEQVD